jgi:hypothetical protein
MKNNLEKLPVNTWVKTKDGIDFVKELDGIWSELFPHCVDCATVLDEKGCENPSPYAPGPTQRRTAEEYMGEYEIVAAPLGFVLEEESITINYFPKVD